MFLMRSPWKLPPPSPDREESLIPSGTGESEGSVGRVWRQPHRLGLPWKRLAQIAVLLVTAGFLAALVASQWSALQAYDWHLTSGWALLALLGLEVGWLVELDTWRIILASLGGPLSFRQAAPIWFLSNIIRYIPGNIWQFLGMAELAHDEGVPRLVTLISIVLHQAISTAVGIVVAAIYFAVLGEGRWLGYLRPLLLLVPLGLLMLQPRILEGVLNWTLRKLGRPPVRVTLTRGQIWILIARYVVVWLAMGLSFAALVRALTPLQPGHTLYLVASWAAAYVIGYLSLLTPAGLGVREGVLAVLLFPIMPQPIAAVVAIMARLWMTVGEVVGAGAGLGLRRATKDEGPRTKE